MASITPDLKKLYTDSDGLALAELVRSGQVTSDELTEVAIGFIEALNPKLNAVVIRDFDRARRRAAEAPGDGPFAGVPYLLKNIGSSCAGMPMTAGTEYRKDYVCASDSELVRRIKAAGMTLLGRTNTPETGWCIATEPRYHGVTYNPWNTAVTCGGSSGGAGAAVAARIVPMAEGTDGGGSIRVPASCCGVVGLKPSRGRITYGPDLVDLWYGSVYFFALTRTVRDSAAFLDATAGALTGDLYTPTVPSTSWLSGLSAAPRRLKIGYTLSTPWGPAFAPEVAEAVKSTVALLEQLGHETHEHFITTDLEEAWISYNQMNSVQTVLEFDGLAREIGRVVRQSELMPFNWSQLERGRSQTATAYGASIDAIRKANQSLQRELYPYDVFVTPTLTQPPRPVGYWDMNESDFDTYIAKWTDAVFMFAFNVSGLPAMSVPAAWTAEDVPLGVQFVGRMGDEASILRLAAEVEQARPWIQRRPAICAA